MLRALLLVGGVYLRTVAFEWTGAPLPLQDKGSVTV